MREGLAAIRIDATTDFFEAAGQRLLAENGLADKDAFVYAQVSRGAAPRYHAFPPEGTTPTVFAFAREVRSASGRRGRPRDPADRRAVGALRHQERDAAAERPRRAEGPRGRRGGRDPRPRRVRARGAPRRTCSSSRRASCAPRRTDRGSCRASRAARPSRPRAASASPSRSARSPSRRCTRRRRSSSPRRRCGPIRSSAVEERPVGGGKAGTGDADDPRGARRGVPRREGLAQPRG